MGSHPKDTGPSQTDPILPIVRAHASTIRRLGAWRVRPSMIQRRVSAGSMTASISRLAASLIALPRR